MFRQAWKHRVCSLYPHTVTSNFSLPPPPSPPPKKKSSCPHVKNTIIKNLEPGSETSGFESAAHRHTRPQFCKAQPFLSVSDSLWFTVCMRRDSGPFISRPAVLRVEGCCSHSFFLSLHWSTNCGLSSWKRRAWPEENPTRWRHRSQQRHDF